MVAAALLSVLSVLSVSVTLAVDHPEEYVNILGNVVHNMKMLTVVYLCLWLPISTTNQSNIHVFRSIFN